MLIVTSLCLIQAILIPSLNKADKEEPMKTCSVALLIINLYWIATYAWGRPVDLSAPTGGLGSSDSRGYLEVWREIDGVGLQLDKDSYLPLRYKFSSEPNTEGILGPGFYCPMFDATSVLIRESTMRTYFPCGKTLYFWRDNLDPNKFESLNGEWSGYLQGDNFIVWRDDGWKVLYKKSRLTSLSTDDNHTFVWSYDDAGMPISITRDGQTMITVERNAAGQAAAFNFDGKRCEMTYANRPITEMLLGQTVIKELDKALSSFKYPDGSMETFNFSLTSDPVPTLTFTNSDHLSTLFTWDVATNHLATERGPYGDWNYKIGAITQPFGLPPISMMSPDGRNLTTLIIDTKMGTYTKTDSDGTTTVTQFFETPGPLYQKVRKIEQIVGKATTLLYSAGYDEAGRLIRKIDENGRLTTYKYDSGGNLIGQHISIAPEPGLLQSLANEENELLKRVKTATTLTDRNSALHDLIIFYAAKALDFNKEAALLNIVTDRNDIYNLKLFLAISNPNNPVEQRNQMLAQLAQEFPDKKVYTENLMINPKTDQETK